MTREIIFTMTDPDYRVVCRFGYSNVVSFAWWGHVQRRHLYKRFILFGKTMERWSELDSCWWAKEIIDRSMLERSAISFYDDTVLLPKRIVERAISPTF